MARLESLVVRGRMEWMVHQASPEGLGSQASRVEWVHRVNQVSLGILLRTVDTQEFQAPRAVRANPAHRVFPAQRLRAPPRNTQTSTPSMLTLTATLRTTLLRRGRTRAHSRPMAETL